MPKPNKSESKQDYLSRCTKELIKKEGRSKEQAYRLCNVYWDESQNQRSVLTLSAPLKLEVEGDEDPKEFMITGYTGSSIDTGYRKIIFDVNGIKTKAKFPVLREHARDRIVGYAVKAWNDESHLYIKGEFAKNTQDAKEVKSLAMEGFPWQASVGIWPEKIMVLDSDKESAHINGQDIQGPIEIWTESRVGEISFVSLGADSETAAVVLSDDGDKVPVVIENENAHLEFLSRMGRNNLREGGNVMPNAVDVLQSKDKMFKEAEVKAFLDLFKNDQLTADNRELIEGAFKLLGVAKDGFPKDFAEKLAEAVPELGKLITLTTIKEKKVEVPADEKKIRKEVEAELRKEMKLEKDAAVVKLEGVVETMKKELGDTKTALDKEKEIRELAEIQTFIKDKNIPGDIEKMSRTILLARKANPEMAKDLEETLAATGAALEAAGVFSEAGGSGDGDPSGSAFEKLQKMVTETMENDKLESQDAWAKVVRQNAALYKEYTQGQAAAIKEVH